jgi:hypothetical protein
MRRNGFALALSFAVLCALSAGASAQTARFITVDPGAAAEAYRESRFQAALTLEVTPLDAQILLDGSLIGTARQLVAQAVPVLPGWHTVEVGAPGYYPYTGHFAADQHSSANSFVVSLVPVR